MMKEERCKNWSIGQTRKHRGTSGSSWSNKPDKEMEMEIHTTHRYGTEQMPTNFQPLLPLALDFSVFMHNQGLSLCSFVPCARRSWHT